jgi:hypothetical protein
LRLGAADLKGVAAGAGDGRLDVVWMDVGLHATPAASRRLWACWSDTRHARRIAQFISIPHLDQAPLGQAADGALSPYKKALQIETTLAPF